VRVGLPNANAVGTHARKQSQSRKSAQAQTHGDHTRQTISAIAQVPSLDVRKTPSITLTITFANIALRQDIDATAPKRSGKPP
jgi:hypothetical protein